jgi:two-component system sensor kinase FixL
VPFDPKVETLSEENIESVLARKPKNRGMVLGLAALLFVLVVSFEWVSELEFSLGVFYVFPIIVAATVINRRSVVVLAFVCAFVRGQFIAGLATHEFWLRFLMATLAYSGVGLFVAESTRNRRTALAAYAQIRLEKEMRQRAEDQLRILVESSPAAILTLNYRAEVLGANRAAHEMLGYEYPGELVGRSIAESVPVLAGALRVTTDVPIRTATTSWARRSNGVTFPVAAWFSTYGQGEGRCLAAILVDSSEEVRERERESLRYMLDSSRLLAGAVSHEIRNMCSAIRVMTLNLSKKDSLASDADFTALTVLVNGLASIAAFDLDKKKQPDAGWIELNRIFEQLRVVIEPDWSENDGSVEWRLEVPSPRVYAEPHELLQIFLNLSQNSLRAAANVEHPRLMFETYTQGEFCIVSAIDNGRGIEDPERLFQPFHPEANGSGLGLFISRTLAKSFGGQLNFVPAEQGCRFDLVLLRKAEGE